MIKYLFTIFIFIPHLLIAQNPLARTKLPAQFITYDVKGEKEIPSNKYKGYLFAYDATANQLIWYAKINEEMIILQLKFKSNLFAFQHKTFSRCEYKNDKIYLCSRVPNKAEEVCGVFSWNNFIISYEKEERFDPNPTLLKNADSLTTKGDFVKAAQIYKSMTHFSSYANPQIKAAELFHAAYNKAQTLATQNRFKNAIDILRPIMPTIDSMLFMSLGTATAYEQAFAKKMAGMSKEDCSQKMFNYMEWTLKNREYDYFLANHGIYMLLNPKDPEWFRLRGDAYFGKRDREKYKDNYLQYINKMKLLKKEKDVPAYVEPRSK